MTEFYTPQEFRHQFKPPLGANFTYDALKSGRIRSIKPSNKYLIPVSEVNRFVYEELRMK